MPGIINVDRIQSSSGNPIVFNNLRPGVIVGSTTIRNSTRTAIGLSSESIIFSGSFTKTRSNTNIVATCTVFGAGYASGNCGTGLRIDGSNWRYGVAYQYDGAWSAQSQTTIVFGTCFWDNVTVGAHTIGFGWKTANGSTTDRPFNFLNPSTPDDSRNQQMTSSIVVYEVIV